MSNSIQSLNETQLELLKRYDGSFKKLDDKANALKLEWQKIADSAKKQIDTTNKLVNEKVQWAEGEINSFKDNVIKESAYMYRKVNDENTDISEIIHEWLQSGIKTLDLAINVENVVFRNKSCVLDSSRFLNIRSINGYKHKITFDGLYHFDWNGTTYSTIRRIGVRNNSRIRIYGCGIEIAQPEDDMNVFVYSETAGVIGLEDGINSVSILYNHIGDNYGGGVKINKNNKGAAFYLMHIPEWTEQQFSSIYMTDGTVFADTPIIYKGHRATMSLTFMQNFKTLDGSNDRDKTISNLVGGTPSSDTSMLYRIS